MREDKSFEDTRSRTIQANRLIGLGMLLNSVLLASACASARGRGDEHESRANVDLSLADGAIVLVGSVLEEGSGSVLDAMIGKVPSFRVLLKRGQCPDIRLRSSVNANGLMNPHIYIDGTRATNTCLLESLRANDIERVEVYPQGFTKRPGYGTHAHGLILLFTRSA